MNFDFYFEKILNFYNVLTIKELSKTIDTAQSTISNWNQRKSLTAIKKKCRELGIYNEIFGDSFNTFTQTGANSRYIQTQNNDGPGMINYSNNSLNVDDELLPLFQALSSVANALGKKEQLKQELTDLISRLPVLQNAQN